MTGASSPPRDLERLAHAFQLQQAGRFDQAEAAYAEVLAADPDDVVALINGGALALSRNDLAQAIARLERAVALVPGNAIAACNFGYALIHADRDADALIALDRAVAAKPDYAQAHNNRGIALARLGRRSEAIAAFERALIIAPNYGEAAANLGEQCNRAGEPQRAIIAFDRALAIDPRSPAARAGRGFATALAGDLDGAGMALETLVREAPRFAPAWQTLGAVRNWAWAHEAAEDAFRHALELDPGLADAQFGIASTLLARGRYAEGWREFERRFEGALGASQRFPRLPVWDGHRFEDDALLLYAEQGLGDIVQFCRFLPLLRERVGRVVLLLDGYWRPLAPLLATLGGVDRIVTAPAEFAGEPVRTRASVLSLPYLAGARPNALPAPPYLSARGDRVAAWTERLASPPHPRVGIAWAAFARDEHGYVTRHKSVPVAALAPLLDVSGVQFVSLQPGAAGDPAAFSARATRIADFTADLHDFGETAALIEGLDLVISTDTAVAHVAGALGKPVWLLDRFNSCWRWRLAPDTSPWYPRMRIFRQASLGDWTEPMARVRAALEVRLREPSA